jgi:hemerythrin-like domain-containing protein
MWSAAMIIERLSQEHRNIEKLLAILERELEVFDRGDRPDYKVIRAVICVRPIGNFVWNYRCRIEGNRVLWASAATMSR